MDEAYLEVNCLEDVCHAPIETIITLFIIKYCASKVRIRFIRCGKKADERSYTIDVSSFSYTLSEMSDVPSYARFCYLPNIIVNKTSCVAGLCAILRQIIKSSIAEQPAHYCHTLLGFKYSSLLACSESSVWTKFCEVDMISTMKTLNQEETDKSELPVNLARFECHMSHQPRMHNFYKYTMSKKFAPGGITTQDRSIIPQYDYANGNSVTLADMIILVCVHIIFNLIKDKKVLKILPLTVKWYEKVIQDNVILKCLICLPEQGGSKFIGTNYSLPVVDNQSLVRRRYKSRNRIFTKQEVVDSTLEHIKKFRVNTKLNEEPFGADVTIDWNKIPQEATPVGGGLPIARLKRKFEQLENLCQPVIKLAVSGNVIVDFCSGSGHLGILVAYMLPECTVILLENKEESLNRAKERVAKLQLKNVYFYQCNLDYFKGQFDIGMSLHACGVATDLVIQHCMRINAVFVSCPCCYGAIQICHHITYPRSDLFKKLINTTDYLAISHAADQTHEASNAKTKQGYACMAVIDADRRLLAEEFGYTVHVSKLIPESCTPKNHLLVGIPGNRVMTGS
ncbi:glutathione S-transferase C-terminal domain-containing protein homolog [Cephus cinctus]|uniref:Glutathione S-transferase C-terminal domain-containing protein homolog n=1 Tax=Cephus cinctus TaxID=211228 RepID=A0AAJ7BHJ5_CEPCN|nr:glutathione S-transferase C-terminal domain-containing protein homolog [Cephus cinctus]